MDLSNRQMLTEYIESIRSAKTQIVVGRFEVVGERDGENRQFRNASTGRIGSLPRYNSKRNMIDQLEFYHGAAIVRLIEDTRCISVGKAEYGYLVNGDRLVLVKYTRKAHSPWRFNISQADIERLDGLASKSSACLLALVCGGDGVCAVSWKAARQLVGSDSGWLSAKRGHNGCYAVSGPVGELRRKVPLNQWPAIVFEGDQSE